MDNIIKQIKKANMVFVCGNGGSAATAEHLSNDLFSKGIVTICLSSNTSIITMIANDYGYKYIFKRQLDLLASEDDLLIVFSVSGTSPNILEALEAKCPAITFFGNKGESYEDAEDRHLQIVHQIKKLL